MAKDQALRIIDSLGADNITAELKLSRHSVRAARLKGELPGRWYGPVKIMCDRKGEACPLAAFTWVVPIEGQPATEASNG